jgi:hypothetical protein
MFSSIKGKLQYVQDEIATSLKNLKLDRHLLRITGVGSGIGRLKLGRASNANDSNDPHIQAGCRILEHYNSTWGNIHKKTEQLAHAAEETDILTARILIDYERKLIQLQQLSALLAVIPKFVHKVQEVSDHILNAQCALEETNHALVTLEDMIETQELREKELEHRFQLALYQSKRAAELNDLKEQLTNEHLLKMKEFDKEMSSQLKEKQAEYQEAFEQDLQQYKEGNFVPRKTSSAASSAISTPLEGIDLEEDPFILEEFLLDEDEAQVLDNSEN